MFKNRIIEYGVKPASEFLAHPKNARLHPQFQRDAMKAALETVGFVAPVLEAKSGYLVDGHERVWQALATDADVPYVKLDIDESEEAFVLATFDPLTSLASYDRDVLDTLLREVNSDSASIQQMLSELAVSVKVIPPNDPYAEWQGMPEFEQESANAYHSIHVHFASEQAIAEFAEVIGQTVTSKTTYIHYPYQAKENLKPYQVVDES